ncbi:hypothetical protein M9H77_26562 [Catharanthus roseus]|uniref:Uncharacterized protein n=1 Tax=Catharanthus roseus TaxID=4058 RepID=A0ACC0AAX9_CATRO|nr:hypothetical protein M9H77_26562 [Catharanthus roseus]
MSWNALNPPKLFDNPIGHIWLNTIKVCKHPMLYYSDITSSSDQQPDNSFASTCEACPNFWYKYANVAVPHANPPTERTSLRNGHSFPGTILPLLSLRIKSTTREFCNLCQVLTIYTNTGVGNMQVALNNCNQLLSRIMMIDNVTISRAYGNYWCTAVTSPQKQIIWISSDAKTCKTSNVIIPSPGPTVQLQDY